MSDQDKAIVNFLTAVILVINTIVITTIDPPR